LPDDAAARCTKHAAHGDLVAPRGRLREEQIRDVRARDEQEQQRRSEKE